ncbi:MAG: hypothetical protein M3310_08110 [Actinomycetota bacterium]|nr:hypothetical protein [Actinomycetota bacterium]
MSYFRRLRNSDADADGDEAASSEEGHDSSAEKFAPYSLGAAATADDADPARDEGSTSGYADRSRDRADADESPRTEPIPFDQVGEHVSAVLSSAHEAADRLRASATEEAEQIRAKAEEYADKTRAAADAYAEERRENAETKASAITTEAEKRARSLRDAARKDAADIQRDAVQRREALLEESERSEERLRNLLQVFRAMTERLENLVGADSVDPREGDAEAESEPDENLAEALMLEQRANEGRSKRTSAGGR